MLVLNDKVADPRGKPEAEPYLESSGNRELDSWLFGNFSQGPSSPPQPAAFLSVLPAGISREREMSVTVSALRWASGKAAGDDTTEIGGGSSSRSGLGRKRACEDEDHLRGMSVIGQEAVREAPGHLPRGGLSLPSASTSKNIKSWF